MTPNVPASVFNALVTVFFIVLAIGAGLGAYAAVSLKKLEKRSQPQMQPVQPQPVEPAQPQPVQSQMHSPQEQM
jgi:hypothetical protein